MSVPAADGVDPGDADNRRKGVAHSLETIERALGNFANLTDHVYFYKVLTGELRRNLDDERQQRTDAQRHSLGLQTLLATERERAALAERRNVAAAELINELKAQLASVHAETRRLVTAVEALGAVHFDAGAEAAHERLAA